MKLGTPYCQSQEDDKNVIKSVRVEFTFLERK